MHNPILQRGQSILIVFLLLACAACSPGEDNLRATETSIAASIFSTLTASVPTATLEPTATATLAATATLEATPLPPVQAVIRAGKLNLRDGPSTDYPQLGTLNANETVSVLGQYEACQWLLVRRPNGLSGWIRSGDNYAEFDQPCAEVPAGLFRPMSGAVLADNRYMIGQNEIQVENGLTSDAVIVLTNSNKLVVYAFYVRTPEKYHMLGIPDGVYSIYYMSGSQWNWTVNDFTTHTALVKINKEATFLTTSQALTIETLALQTIDTDSKTADEVPPEDFPDLQP